ncbi:MAG: condensation domain-containing protein, partial [Acidobacteriota bacterium]
GRPRLMVEARSPALARIELGRLSEVDRQGEADRLRTSEAARPFDLARGPLLRTVLLHLGPAEHVFVATFHHIITDGWSTAIFLRELVDLYAGDQDANLPPLPVQYGDYAAWQRRWLTGEVLEGHLAWWRRRLGGDLPPLALPTDRPRSSGHDFRSARLTQRLPAATAEALVALGQDRGATLFMILLAALQVLLGRWSGQSRVLVGTPIAGRTRQEIEGLIGFFINTLVLRGDLGDDPPFEDLLARTRDEALGAYAHQDVPFEKLVAALDPDRDLDRTPLFQVFFNLLNLGVERLEVEGLAFEVLPAAELAAKFDLTLYAAEVADELRLDWVYNASLFSHQRIVALTESYGRLLQQIAAAPGRRIQSYSLRDEALLPDPRRALPRHGGTPLGELFHANVRRGPNRPAVTDERATWTYRDLAERSGGIARALQRHGVGRERVVAIYGERSAALVAAILGVVEAGGAFLLLDPAYPAARLVDCLKRAGIHGWLQLSEPPAELEAAARELASICRLALSPEAEVSPLDTPPVDRDGVRTDRDEVQT